MSDFYSMCITALNKSEFYQADGYCNRYYYRMLNKMIFTVNVNPIDECVEVVYGVCLPQTVENLFSCGVEDGVCTLRRCAYIREYGDMKKVYATVADFFYRWKRLDVTERDILSCVNLRKRKFTDVISEILLPLGFQKSGYKWTYYKDERFSLELYMQKSPKYDAYYFNVSLMNNDIGMPCYSSRLSVGMYDWQLGDRDVFVSSLEDSVKNEMLPLINGTAEELGESELVKKHCYCKRSVCENCWVKG